MVGNHALAERQARGRRQIYRTVKLRLNCIGSVSAASDIVTRDATLSADIPISYLNEIDIRTDARFPGYGGLTSARPQAGCELHPSPSAGASAVFSGTS